MIKKILGNKTKGDKRETRRWKRRYAPKGGSWAAQKKLLAVRKEYRGSVKKMKKISSVKL